MSHMLTPLCHALSGSVFHPTDTACTGVVSAGVINRDFETSAYPRDIGPLLPGYCYPNIYFSFQHYTVYSYSSSIVAYCDADGTAHITSYRDEDCTKPDITTPTATATATVAGAEGTCLSMRIFKNYTYSSKDITMNIRINCTHSLSTSPRYPGPYVNVSAVFYPSSPTCNDFSPSPSPSPSPQYNIPAGPNDQCVTVEGLAGSFRIDCFQNLQQMHMWSDKKCHQINTTIGIEDYTSSNTTTCATELYVSTSKTPRTISARIDCGSAPYNGQPQQYLKSNRTYIVTGFNYQHSYLGNKCDYVTSPASFGPFLAGSCQVFANNKSSYMITCSSDGSGIGRINVFHGTTTCDTKQFFSFAQGQADGRTCLPFSMANGDAMFQQQGTTILCKIPSQPTSTNSSPSLYRHSYTYMVLLCALLICINAFASI